jgi:hypothetical protein
MRQDNPLPIGDRVDTWRIAGALDRRALVGVGDDEASITPKTSPCSFAGMTGATR